MKNRTTDYVLIFHRADSAPDVDTTVLCTDGAEIDFGYYGDSTGPAWFHQDGKPWPDVRAWAEPPGPNECMADCYPDRVCEGCGRTHDQIHACGSFWSAWGLCGKCAGEGETGNA